MNLSRTFWLTSASTAPTLPIIKTHTHPFTHTHTYVYTLARIFIIWLPLNISHQSPRYFRRNGAPGFQS